MVVDEASNIKKAKSIQMSLGHYAVLATALILAGVIRLHLRAASSALIREDDW